MLGESGMEVGSSFILDEYGIEVGLLFFSLGALAIRQLLWPLHDEWDAAAYFPSLREA